MTEKMTQRETERARAALKDAFHKAGRERIADLCGCSRSATYHWDICPPHHVLTIEAATGVPRSFLRPDLYPGIDPDTLRGDK